MPHPAGTTAFSHLRAKRKALLPGDLSDSPASRDPPIRNCESIHDSITKPNSSCHLITSSHNMFMGLPSSIIDGVSFPRRLTARGYQLSQWSCTSHYGSAGKAVFAKATKDAAQARRLLALAEIHDGGSRMMRPGSGGVTLQIVRDCVVRFTRWPGSSTARLLA